MSWSFNIANWNFELDWQEMTVTPLAPEIDIRRETEQKETPRQIDLGETPTLDEGKTQAWA